MIFQDSQCLLTNFAPVGICHSKTVMTEESRTVNWKDRDIMVYTGVNNSIFPLKGSTCMWEERESAKAGVWNRK